MAEQDAEALRKELGMVKDKAKAFISRLNEEKAGLAKELHEKSAILAGVKDKTKAYVERLNAEKASAVAALEQKIKDRDERLLQAKEQLRKELKAKDEELEVTKAKTKTLRERLEHGEAGRPPELNGDGAAAAVEAVSKTAKVGSAEVESTVNEELQHTLEALKTLESSKIDVENLLAEAKQAAHAAQERLAGVEIEFAASRKTRDEAVARAETLKISLTKAQESTRASEEAASVARKQAEADVRQEKAASAVAVQSLEADLKRANSAAALAAAAHQTVKETLRAELAEREAAAAEAVASAEGRTAAAAAEAAAAEERVEEAGARVARVEKLATSRTASEATEVKRLRREVARGRERAEVAAAVVATMEQAISGMENATEEEASALKIDDKETGASERHGGELVKERMKDVWAALTAFRERLVVDEESSENSVPSVKIGPEVAGAEENGEDGDAAAAAAATSAEKAALLVQEHVREREAAEQELASLRETLNDARADAGKARDDAAKQAEELSSHLMGALEEREEGLRREAVASREVERLKEEVAKAAETAKEAAQGWTDKMKEADNQAKAAEAGTVMVVKGLEEALTQREKEVNLLKDEAIGLRKELSVGKSEIEARGEALRQAKLDLQSAVREASAAGKKASELRTRLDAALAEQTETKMRLESESAANEGLKSAVMEANETVSKRVDGLREATEKAESERDASAAEATAVKAQIQALQAQVGSLLRENAAAKTEAGLRIGELQRRLSEAQSELVSERDAIAERKREMQAYADAMAKEGTSLRASAQEAQVEAARAKASEYEARAGLERVRREWDAGAGGLRHAMEKQRTEAANMVSVLEERNEILEAETSRLQQLMALEFGQRDEKAQDLKETLLDKIEEANLHKKKRLAARTEMISLAKTLENERDGHKAVNHALQYGLMPKAIEQASTLEQVVMTSERAVFRLSRASGVRLASNLQAAQASLARLRGRVAGADDPQVVLHQRQVADLSGQSQLLIPGSGMRGPDDMNSSGFSDRLDSPLGSVASSDHAWLGSGRGRLNDQAAKNSIFLERVRRLELEMNRVSSGLALVSQSVEQLSELAEIQAGLCGAFSVVCCSSRRSSGGAAYSTLEMGNRRLMEGSEGMGGSGSILREDSNDSAGLIRR